MKLKELLEREDINEMGADITGQDRNVLINKLNKLFADMKAGKELMGQEQNFNDIRKRLAAGKMDHGTIRRLSELNKYFVAKNKTATATGKRVTSNTFQSNS